MPDNDAPPRRQRGQAVVLVALMALALVAFVGLALDGGQVYGWRRVMQDAADGGSIAGAYTMTLGASDAEISSTINQYAVVANRAGGFSWSKTGPVATCVTVTATKGFPSLFIGLIGIDNLDTKAQATACAGQPTGAGGIWPVSIPSYSYTISSTFPLSVTNLNWVCFNGANCGGSDLANWIANGFSGTYTQHPDSSGTRCAGADPQVAQLLIPGCIGEKAGQSTLAGQLHDPICGGSGYTSKLGQDFLVPLYDVCSDLTGTVVDCTTGSNNWFHVIGFGRFTLVGIRLEGSNGSNNGCYMGVTPPARNLPACPGGANFCIWGRFVKYTGYSDICVSGCGVYTGTLSVGLIY